MSGDSRPESPAISFRQIIREKTFWLLILMEVLFFYRPIVLGDVFYFRDLSSHFVPVRQLVAEYVIHLEPPLWDPYRQGGKPLLANPNNSALYPSNLLYTFLQPGPALSIEIIAHHLIGMLTLYSLARYLKFSTVPSFIAAVVYSFSGYSLSLTNLLNWHIAAAYIPISILFWHLFLTRRKLLWWTLCALSSSMQVLAGAPELTAMTMILLLGWGIFYPHACQKKKMILSFVLLVPLVAAIAAVQILPAIENARISIRSVGFSFDSATRWSLHPYRFLEFVFPNFLGNLNSVSDSSYWGENLEGRIPFFLSVYFGFPAVVLALSAVLWNKPEAGLRRFYLFLFGLFVVSILFTLGHRLPFVRGIFEVLSLRSPFRFPVKWIGAAILPLSLVAAAGAEGVFSLTRRRTLLLGLWLLAFVLLICLWFVHSSIPLFASLFRQKATVAMQNGLFFATLHSLLVLILFCICITFHRRPFSLTVAAFVVALDLFTAGQALLFLAPADYYDEIPPAAIAVKTHIGTGKLYRTQAIYRLGRVTTDEYFWRTRAEQFTLPYSSAAKNKIPVIFHDDLDGSALVELDYESAVISGLPWKQKHPLLAASGVRLVLTGEQINDAGFLLKQRIANPFGPELLLYEIQHSLPPISFATNVSVAKSAKQAFAQMLEPEFDPATTLILAKPHQSTSSCNRMHVQKADVRKQERSFLIETECPGYLVFLDPAYPGWQVFVNGKKVELHRANVIFSAVYLPNAGNFVIKKEYRPRSIIIGAYLSAAALILLVCLIVAGSRSRSSGTNRT